MMKQKDKWYYIDLISKLSDRNGDKLIDLMTAYNKKNLKEINLDEVKEYFENYTREEMR